MRLKLKYAAIPALIALVLLLRALPELTGKPLFRSPAYNAAEAYLAEHYADLDLAIGDIVWSDHGGDYHVNVYSPSSRDTAFTLVVGSRSKAVEKDTYAEDVLSGKSTADRLYWEYRALADSILERTDFPFTHNISWNSMCRQKTSALNTPPSSCWNSRTTWTPRTFPSALLTSPFGPGPWTQTPAPSGRLRS